MTIPTGVEYVSGFVGDPDAAFQEVLEQVEFIQRKANMYGRTIRVPRQEAWFGDTSYTFSGYTFPATRMPPVVISLAIRVEQYLRESGWYCDIGCMANYYADGADSVSWHSDDDHGADRVVVASVSLGAERRMGFRRKVRTPDMASALLPNSHRVHLDHGSLLVMGEGIQTNEAQK